VSGKRVELWAGWSLLLPADCQVEEKPDGSWSAWDASHRIDLDIIETSGRADGSPFTAEDMLAEIPGERHIVQGATLVVSTYVEETDTPRGPQPVEWTRVTGGAQNTSLMMTIGNDGPPDAAWHSALWRSIAHKAPRSRFKGLFGRLACCDGRWREPHRSPLAPWKPRWRGSTRSVASPAAKPSYLGNEVRNCVARCRYEVLVGGRGGCPSPATLMLT
jgi:hypothetical protein